MTFKDIVRADRDVFINFMEFAERHELNGTQTLAIVQSPTTQDSFLTAERYNIYDEVHGELYIVHCRTADIPHIPASGQVFTLDGTPCIVDNAIDDMGILTIELHAEVA